MGRLSKEQIAFGLYATEMDKIEKRHRKLDDVIDILNIAIIISRHIVKVIIT